MIRSARVRPPPGYALLPDWALAHGRSPHTARIHLQLKHIPEAIRVGRTGRYVAVPEGLPWPAKATGRPRKQPLAQVEGNGTVSGKMNQEFSGRNGKENGSDLGFPGVAHPFFKLQTEISKPSTSHLKSITSQPSKVEQ